MYRAPQGAAPLYAGCGLAARSGAALARKQKQAVLSVISARGKQYVAWLGIFAMLLLVCAPTVSRCFAAAQSLALSICTEAARPGQAAAALNVPIAGHRDAPGEPPASRALNDCGYCTLMTHDGALPSLPPALSSVLWFIVVVLVLPPLRRYTPAGTFLSGLPRAPPRFS
nr:DUF2946 domain-containing protein [Candidimonas nitroreducens]